MLKKRYIVSAVIVFILLVGLLSYIFLLRFDDYSVEENIVSGSTGSTNYENVSSGILAYNPDGVTLLSKTGDKKWNISFEMQSPKVIKNDSFMLIYDNQGAEIILMNNEGSLARIKTSYPISTVSLAKNGSMAVVMQQQNIAYLSVYDSVGEIKAEGELHGEEGGYPLAVTLSADGSLMAVSAVHLSEGNLSTEILFYDFSEEDFDESNISKYVFADDIVPILEHVQNDKILAVSSSKAVVFSAGNEPKEESEIVFEGEIKSVLYSDRYFGTVFESENEDGELVNLMEVYSLRGRKRFSKEIDMTYSKCEFLENNEILVSDGRKTTIYSMLGLRRFIYTFDSEIQNLSYAGSFNGYYLLQGGKLQKIRLK